MPDWVSRQGAGLGPISSTSDLGTISRVPKHGFQSLRPNLKELRSILYEPWPCHRGTTPNLDRHKSEAGYLRIAAGNRDMGSRVSGTAAEDLDMGFRIPSLAFMDSGVVFVDLGPASRTRAKLSRTCTWMLGFTCPIAEASGPSIDV